MNFSRPVRQLFYPGGERQRGDRRETLICVSPPPTLKNQDTMSRHLMSVLNRRLDASFARMEELWAIYKEERTEDHFHAYLRCLRRTALLAKLVNA